MEDKVPAKACKALNNLALYPHLLGNPTPYLSHTGLLAVSVLHTLADFCPRDLYVPFTLPGTWFPHMDPTCPHLLQVLAQMLLSQGTFL